MNPLRVLYLSPGMRQLARVRAEALRQRGAEVLLVTSEQYFPKSEARDYELVLDPQFRKAATWPATVAAWRQIRRYRPDIVISELVTDPRWIALAGRAPRVQLVHDDCPHDADEQQPAYKRVVFDRWGAKSAATVALSDYVAAEIAARRDVAGTCMQVVPLCSDLDDTEVPAFVGADERRDFVMFGRLNPYKNVDIVLEAWQRHVAGGGWRGDDLVFIGDGPAIERTLPKHTRRESGKYRYRDVVATLAAAKGSIAHHRRASQSGVQLLSMHVGVMPIISTAGGLPEFQPPDCPPIDIDDVDGLAAAFDQLADPQTAARCGAAAARHYAERFAVESSTDGLLNVLAEVLAARSPATARSKRGLLMPVVVWAKRSLAPLAKIVAPRSFWRRKYRILQRLSESNAEIQLVRSLCDPNRVALDIGADVGEFAIAMAGSSRSVIAFEPRQAQAQALTAMFDAVGADVRIEAIALSDQPGTTAMRVLEFDPGRSTIEGANALTDADGSPVQTIQVEVKRLDDLGLDNVGLIKIDVEGHELAVLRGAANTLRHNQPALVIEAEERHQPGAVAAVTEFLGGLGYTGYFNIDGTRCPISEFDPAVHQNPANIASWKDGWAMRGIYVNNFVFLPARGG